MGAGDKELDRMADRLKKVLTGGEKPSPRNCPRKLDAPLLAKNIESGAADAPIFWCRSKDDQKYYVILRRPVRPRGDEPPAVPDAQPAAI